MKSSRLPAIVAAALIAMASWAPVPATAQDTAALEIATALLDDLDAGAFAAAEARFTTAMAAAVPADKLRTVWESLPEQAGAAKGRGTPTISAQGGKTLVAVPLHYVKVELVASITVDVDGRVAGFLIQPAPPPPASRPAADANFSETEWLVGDGPTALPGTLTLPQGASREAPVAGVVLVHGSGPHDRDETVGPNRPFLDIARGLAERGIASLRYEKRTKAHPQQFASGGFDLDDETTDDAVAAVAVLRAAAGVDPARVHVLGHSQGALLAPRIAQRAGDVAGLVLLAAPARPVLDLLPEQNRYLFAANGVIEPAEQAFLDDLDRKIAAIRADAPMEPADYLLGLPPHYWRGFDAIDPVADAQALNLPMLLLQGGRDFQVVDADWQRWRHLLGDQPWATFRLYPALNHLGIAGEGPGTLAEYMTPGHVDDELIADIANWINR